MIFFKKIQKILTMNLGIIFIFVGLFSQKTLAERESLIESINIIDSYKGLTNYPKSSPLQDLEYARSQHKMDFQEISQKSEFVDYAKQCEQLNGEFIAEQRLDFFEEVDDLGHPRSPCKLNRVASYAWYYLQCRSNIKLSCFVKGS